MIDLLSESVLKGYGNDLLLEASCLLISSTLSKEAISRRPDLGKKSQPRWRMILDLSLEHQNEVVQTTAARVVGTLGTLRSCERDIDR